MDISAPCMRTHSAFLQCFSVFAGIAVPKMSLKDCHLAWSGYIFYKKATLRSYHLFWGVLLRESAAGLRRIELYENEMLSKENDIPNVVIELEGVLQVLNSDARKGKIGQKHAFQVTTTSTKHQFAARTTEECKTWVDKLNDTLLGPPQPGVVYEFQVQVLPTSHTERLRLNGLYIMRITDTEVMLYTANGTLPTHFHCAIASITKVQYSAVNEREWRSELLVIQTNSNAEVGEGAFAFSSRSAGRIGAVIEYRRSTTSARQQKAHSILTSSQSLSIGTQLQQTGKYTLPSTRHYSEPYYQSQPEQKRKIFPTVISNEFQGLVASKQAHNKTRPVRSPRDALPTPLKQSPLVPPRRPPVQLPQQDETTSQSPPIPKPRRPPVQLPQQDETTSPEAQPSHYQTLIQALASPHVDSKPAPSSPSPHHRRGESTNDETLESSTELEEKQSKGKINSDLENLDEWVGKRYSRAPNFQTGSQPSPDPNYMSLSSNQLASGTAKHSSRPSSTKKPELRPTTVEFGANNKATLPSHIASPISPYAIIQNTSEDPYWTIREPSAYAIDSRPPARLPNETREDEIDHSGQDDEPEYEYISRRLFYTPHIRHQATYVDRITRTDNAQYWNSRPIPPPRPPFSL